MSVNLWLNHGLRVWFMAKLPCDIKCIRNHKLLSEFSVALNSRFKLRRGNFSQLAVNFSESSQLKVY